MVPARRGIGWWVFLGRRIVGRGIFSGGDSFKVRLVGLNKRKTNTHRFELI